MLLNINDSTFQCIYMCAGVQLLLHPMFVCGAPCSKGRQQSAVLVYGLRSGKHVLHTKALRH